MDVILYLTELLQIRTTVGIVGLGTLYKEKIPGKYDGSKHAFIPPSYIIGFTTEISEDEELINFISQSENISVESASFYVEKFAEETQAKLASNQEVNLGELGIFSLIDNEIYFSPVNDKNFDNSFFGLPEIADKANQTNKQSADQTKTEEQRPLQGESVSEEENLTTETEEEIEEKRGLSLGLKFLIAAIIISMLGVVAYFINPTFFNSYLQTNSNNKQENNVAVAAKDTLVVDTNTKKLDTITPLKQNLTDTLTTDTATVYEVIAIAEKSQHRVDNFINLMAKRGIKAKALPKRPGKKLIKISVGTFTDFSLAKKQQDSLRKKLKNPEIYILPIKNQK
jgi:hypothetical protein